ncbi:uncharacterized protein [Elaeis guineensis]|uniref:uncharacterized protein n=1 Tax=Elaeis guineensis var. tenera TaxID=51953 RepID=UPI003C6D33BE
MCMYQLFMEVVSEELGWLDFYPALPCMRHQERKRSKQHALQAEKEIILSTVFGICSDMFSSFSHYSKETQASLDAKLVLYLQRSKNLLVICIEDYWAAYDRLCGLGKATRVQFPEPMTHLWDIGTIRMRHRCCGDPMTREITESNPPYASGINKSSCSDKILDELHVPEAMDATINQNFFIRSSYSLLATIYDIWMGTRLLFLDLLVSVGLIQKQIFGCKLTERERKKITVTLTDIACAIPVAILALLPVTAIGHAAILTAIKRYIPRLLSFTHTHTHIIRSLFVVQVAYQQVLKWKELSIRFYFLTLKTSMLANKSINRSGPKPPVATNSVAAAVGRGAGSSVNAI